MLAAGSLNKFIIIQRPVEVRNEFNELERTAWEDYANLRANIEPIGGREYFNAGAAHADITHRIRVRYLTGITTSMRIMHGSREFDIQAVIDPGERHRELEIMAVERVD